MESRDGLRFNGAEGGSCGEYPFFRIIYITQEKGLCSESVTECEKQVCR